MIVVICLAFSAGVATVLTALGLIVLYVALQARRWLIGVI